MKYHSDSIVKRFQRNVKKYDIEHEKRIAVLFEKENLLFLNKSEIRIGTDSGGKPFSNYFDLSYAQKKRKLSSYKPVSPRPDMYLTGELQKEMDLKVKGRIIQIFSTDPKANEKLRGRGAAIGRFKKAFGFNSNVKPIALEIVTSEFLSNTYIALFNE